MRSMIVTLEVSKLSGWLNADARCRESKGRNAVQGEVYGLAGGSRRATTPRRKESKARNAAHGSSVQGRVRPEVGGADSSAVGARVCAERTVNMPLMSLTLDVSKLSGWLNTLAYCRESEGGHTV